uniref:transcription antitermination factor NusB n=1 Tax=Nosocomiicoccus massiliensis TaxID=1232430 RepID=UPI000593F0DB
MNRHEQRIKAFQILFQIDNDAVSLGDVKFKEMYSKYDYIKQLVDYYIEHQNDIDDKISSLLKNYTLDRISKVDRNVLRVSVT